MKEPTVDSWQRETSYVFFVMFVIVLLLGMILGLCVYSCEAENRSQSAKEVMK